MEKFKLGNGPVRMSHGFVCMIGSLYIFRN